MTRINTIDVEHLTDQHLLAEIREITRLPGNLEKSLNRKSKPFSEAEIPSEYKLGKNHVKFFYDKFQWLERRFTELLEECDKRGFRISNKDASIFRNVPKKYYKDWEVTFESRLLNEQRLGDRITAKPDFYRYYGRKL